MSTIVLPSWRQLLPGAPQVAGAVLGLPPDTGGLAPTEDQTHILDSINGNVQVAPLQSLPSELQVLVADVARLFESGTGTPRQHRLDIVDVRYDPYVVFEDNIVKVFNARALRALVGAPSSILLRSEVARLPSTIGLTPYPQGQPDDPTKIARLQFDLQLTRSVRVLPQKWHWTANQQHALFISQSGNILQHRILYRGWPWLPNSVRVVSGLMWRIASFMLPAGQSRTARRAYPAGTRDN